MSKPAWLSPPVSQNLTIAHLLHGHHPGPSHCHLLLGFHSAGCPVPNPIYSQYSSQREVQTQVRWEHGGQASCPHQSHIPISRPQLSKLLPSSHSSFLLHPCASHFHPRASALPWVALATQGHVPDAKRENAGLLQGERATRDRGVHICRGQC